VQSPDAKPKFSIIRRAFESLMVLGGLAGGGMALGYYAAVQVERASHVQEIARLQAAYGVTIEALTKRLDATADRTAKAATKVDAAANTVGDVVDKVDAAASKADRAARAAVTTAAKAAAVTKQTPAPSVAVQPEVVNREIRRANERIGQGERK
jgi:hypothetical protein